MAVKEAYAPNSKARKANRDVAVIETPEKKFVFKGLPEGLSQHKKSFSWLTFAPQYSPATGPGYNRWVDSLVANIAQGLGPDQRIGNIIYVTSIKFHVTTWCVNANCGQLVLARGRGRPIDDFLSSGPIMFQDEDRFNVLYESFYSQEAGYLRPTIQDELIFNPPLKVLYRPNGTPVLNNEIYIGCTSSANLVTNQVTVRVASHVSFLA